ncbi:MAG: triacylglycerol lipase [Kofleriaceae bacterium]|nr:triacylglycerol lipase [Myxococcales bacterium]MCB9559871.1 triacylglycerol lipase [Kofleriaceae bacterium]MCB9571483.1 triacylglycerol lipase [Kofleriaceae bacterium]
MPSPQRIYLIPGFFGFANLGDLKYFAHVREELGAVLARRGVAAEIHYVRTLPTASLRRRAAQLAETIAATATDDGPLHLVGHSAGGVDARLFASPGVSLPCPVAIEPLAARVRTVVTIASPHHGTPQVTTMTSVVGQRLLRVLSMLTLHGLRLGSVPLPALVALAGALPRATRAQGPITSILDQIYRQLLRDFDVDRQREIEAFFTAAGDSPALLSQLSPDGMDLFNAATAIRPGTRYGAVIARGRPPAWRTALDLGLSPSAHATYALYRALYELASTMPAAALPPLAPAQRAALTAAYGDVPDATANDAIVPTLSQVHGDVIYAAWADHLDVIGHFTDPRTEPPHVDWLVTRSGFDRRRFDALWQAVGAYLVPG